MSELVVTGVRQLAPTGAANAAEKAAAREESVMRTAADTELLADGRRQLVLHDPLTNTWIAVRADLDEEELRALSRRLRRPAVSR